jgi:hypothetical protein
MKYFLPFLILILSNLDARAQVKDSTEWQKYYVQMKQRFKGIRDGWASEFAKSEHPDYGNCWDYNREYAHWQWVDSIINEWEKIAVKIQNDNSLSDTAKILSSEKAYMKLILRRHESVMSVPAKFGR